MLVFYFSGTGNSKFIAEKFSKEMQADCHSIEEDVNFSALIDDNEDIGFCYPIYNSRAPRIMREFADEHAIRLKDKNLLILCTQMIFSGDGARSFTDLFPDDHVNVIYAEHFVMPNNVPNYPLPDVFLVPSDGKIKKCFTGAERKVERVCRDVRNGVVRKRGFNVFSKMLGVPQAVTALAFEKKANESFAVGDDCNGCGLCAAVCPMENLTLQDGVIVHKRNCTVCFRCINRCPRRAISILFGKRVRRQYRGLNGIK